MAMSGSYGPYTVVGTIQSRFEWSATKAFNTNSYTITQNVYVKNNSGDTADIGLTVITNVDSESIENVISATSYSANQEKLVLTRQKTITGTNDGSRSVTILFRIKSWMPDLVGGTVTLDNNSNGNIKISTAWKKAFHWINISGTWKRAVAWTKISGTWKRGV